MKFYKKNCAGLIFCLVLLTVTPIGSKPFDKDFNLSLVNAAIPALSGFATLLLGASPPGLFLLGGLGIIHLVSLVLIDKQDGAADTSLSNLDLWQLQSKVINNIDKVDRRVLQESDRIIRVLGHLVESHEFSEDLRNTLEYFEKECAEDQSVIVNTEIPVSSKETYLRRMIDPHSDYREKLRYFITKFIQSNIRLPATEPVKLFFEYIQQRDRILALENADSYTESMHTQLFKAYMYIAEILTNAYGMPIAAHVIQYQIQEGRNEIREAAHTKNSIKKLIDDYNMDMKALIDKTESVLENASREIRNPGKFIYYEKGETFDYFTFAWTLPSGNCDGNVRYNKQMFQAKGIEHEFCFNSPKPIPLGSVVYFYRNSEENNIDRPYHYMRYYTKNGASEVFGHNNISSSDLKVDFVTNTANCPPTFCPVFLKSSASICTKPVMALPGNVVTGVRFRLENGMLYIDIQQAPFQNILSVENTPSPFWLNTEDNGNYEILNKDVKKLELGNFEFDASDNKYMTGIQLRRATDDSGMIRVHIIGSEIPFETSNRKIFSNISPSNELLLNELDDPTMGGLENLISPAPEKDEPYFIDFQHSSFEKDFGRSTIPFIDTREVISDPPAPMKGFGIYHEAGEDSGGFIALKLISPKLTHFTNYANQIAQFTNYS